MLALKKGKGIISYGKTKGDELDGSLILVFWTGLGQAWTGLGRSWTGLGQILDRFWTGAGLGQVLDSLTATGVVKLEPN